MGAEFFNIYLQTGINILILLSNIAVFGYCIYRRLFRKEIALTLFLCFADTVQVAAQTFAWARKTYLVLFDDPMKMITNWDCFLLIYPIILFFSFLYTGWADLLFSAEKMLMIMSPLRYHKVQLRHIWYVLLVSTFAILAITAWIGFSWGQLQPFAVTSYCNVEHMPLQYKTPLTLARMFLMVLSVLIYLPVVVKLHQILRKLRQKSKRSNEYDRTTLKMGVHAGLLLLCIFISMVIPDVVSFLFLQFYLNHQVIFFNLSTLKLIVNVIFAVSVIQNIDCSTERRQKNPTSVTNVTRRKTTR